MPPPSLPPQPQAVSAQQLGLGNMPPAQAPQLAEGLRGLRGDAPGSISNCSSGLHVRASGGPPGAFHESSAPDTTEGGSTSPLSGCGSDGRATSAAEAAAAANAATAVTAMVAACLDDDAEAVPITTPVHGMRDAAGTRTEAAFVPGAAAAVVATTTAAAMAATAAAAAATAAAHETVAEAEQGGDDTAEGDVAAAVPRKLTGWALVAAKTPPRQQQRAATGQQPAQVPRSAPAPKEQQAAGTVATAAPGATVARRADAPSSALSRLHPSVREEVERLIAKLNGAVRVRNPSVGAGLWGLLVCSSARGSYPKLLSFHVGTVSKYIVASTAALMPSTCAG